MKKYLIGILLSITLAYTISAIAYYVFNIPQLPQERKLSNTSVSSSVLSALNVIEKVEIQTTTSSEDALYDWELSATVLGTQSVAMVVRDRDALVLKINDVLEGYRVKKIEASKVLFVANNQNLWLHIRSNVTQSKNSNVKKDIPKSGTYTVRKSLFEKTLLNPENLLKTVNILPEMNNGEFKGMKINSLKTRSFLYVHGLRQEDIITSINGQKLLSIADGIKAYQNILSSDKFSISILRDNKIEELKYEIIK
jgi:type II secretion system protein C